MDLGRPGWIFGPGVVKAGRCEYNSGTNLVSSQPLVWSTRQVLRWWYGVSSISCGVFYDKMTSATSDTCTWTSVSAVNLCLSGVKYQQSNTWLFFLSQLSWTRDTLAVCATFGPKWKQSSVDMDVTGWKRIQGRVFYSDMGLLVCKLITWRWVQMVILTMT